MAWLTSSLRQRGASLSPLIGFVHDAAASVILVVLMLGALCSRLFGVSKEREAEAELGGSDAVLTRSARSTDAGAAASADVDDGFVTPVQTRISSPSENLYGTDVRRTPPGQMLFSGMGPTPGTPAPAHPVAMTVPARRTSAPPSPTNILPRNLEAVLLAAAANTSVDDATPSCAAISTSLDAQGGDVQEAAPSPADNADAEPLPAIPAVPLSTPPPAPPPFDSIRQCTDELKLKPRSTVLSTPLDALNAKSESTYLPDAVPTVPRRVPTANATVPAARVLTGPFEIAAELEGIRTPAHPAAAAASAAEALTAPAAARNDGCSALGADDAAAAAAATLAVADTPTCSWTTRHQMNALFREMDDGNVSDSPESCRRFAATAAAAGGGGAARSDLSHAAGAAAAGFEGHPRREDENDDGDGDTRIRGEQRHQQQPHLAAARALGTGLLPIAAIELPATPTSPVPVPKEASRMGEADTATQAPRGGSRRIEAEWHGGAGGDEVAEPCSPLEVAETPIAFGNLKQQPLLVAASPALTPVASPAPRNRSTAAAGAAAALAAVNGNPQAKIRGTPVGPKQQQQPSRQSTRGAAGVAPSKVNGSIGSATPRMVANSLNQKRGVASPMVAGAAATPATARRPVGQLALVRSPRATAEKNPVARKLNPASPRQDVIAGADALAAAAAAAGAGQDGASVSPSLCSTCSEPLAADSGLVPRYAAPTAASIARKTQLLPGPAQRGSTRTMLAAGMSVGGVDGGGVGIGVEDGGGGAVGGTPRRNGQEAKLRSTVSNNVLGA